MSIPFSSIMAGAKARKAQRREERSNKTEALRASVAARSVGIVRHSLSEKEIEEERYKRQMGLL